MGTRLFIGGLSHFVQVSDVERFFKGYGHIQHILLKKGFGFVEFAKYTDTDRIIYSRNGKELCGKKVWLDHAKPSQDSPPGGKDGDWMKKYGPPSRTDNRLLVKNLSSEVTWQGLKDHVRKVGEVTFAEAHTVQQNVGMVEFASARDMKKAVETLDGAEMSGRTIKLVEDKDSRSPWRFPGPRSYNDFSQSKKLPSSHGGKHRCAELPRSHSSSRSKNSHRSSSAKSRSRSPAYSRSRSRVDHGQSSRNRAAFKRSRTQDDRVRSRSRHHRDSHSIANKTSSVNRSRMSPEDTRSRSRSQNQPKSRSLSRSKSIKSHGRQEDK